MKFYETRDNLASPDSTNENKKRKRGRKPEFLRFSISFKVNTGICTKDFPQTFSASNSFAMFILVRNYYNKSKTTLYLNTESFFSKKNWSNNSKLYIINHQKVRGNINQEYNKLNKKY